MGRIDLRKVDLNLLVALDQLLATGHVGAAAKQLGLSQPAMSRTLGRLRDLLGDPLFVKVGRGVVATDRARALAEPVKTALDAARDALAQPAPFDPSTATDTFTIALGDEAQVAFADVILTSLWARAPGIDVRVRRLGPESVAEGRRGLFDLAVAPNLSTLPAIAGAVDLSDFVVKHVYERRFVVASSAAFPRRRWTLDSWCAAEHAIVSFEGGGRGFVDEILEGLGRSRRVAVSLTSFDAVARVVAATRLVAVLPAEVARVAGNALVTARAPIALPTLPMLLVWHPRHTTDARHRFLREVVYEAIRRRPRGASRRR